MKIKLLLLFLTGTILQSCMYQKADSIANKNIDQSLRNIIKAKNDSLFEALSNSDKKVLTQLGTPQFGKFLNARLGSVLWVFRGGVLETKYTVFDEYYNTHSTVPDNSVITNEDHGYTFTFQNNEKETYLSLLKFSRGGIDDYLITVIYNRMGNDWKIEKVEGGQLGIYGKTAHDLFNEAKKYKQSKFPLDAWFYLDAANTFLHPAGKMLAYDQETKMGIYTPIWTNEVNSLYKFPYTLDNIDTQPAIHQITCVKNPEGYYPLISYVTQVSVKDMPALSKEFEQIKNEIKKNYSTAMDFKKPYMYYRAYNLLPGSTQLGESFLIRDELVK